MWVSWCSGRNSVVHGLISVCPNSSAKSQPNPSRQRADQGVGHRRHRVDGAAQARTGRGPANDRVLQHRPVHHRQPEHLGDALAFDEVEQSCRVEAAQHVDGGADQHAGVQNALSCAVWNIGIIAANESAARQPESSAADIDSR